MKIFTYGLDHINIQHLKDAGYEVVTQNILPDVAQVGKHLLLFTSLQVAVPQLPKLREAYPEALLLYWHLGNQLKQLAPVYMACNTNNISFLPPRSTTSALIEKLKIIFEEETGLENHIIGVFGSGPGIGCTSVAKVLARKIAATGKKTILLGLNLYDPGMNQPGQTSLDQIRSRITRKMIAEKDIDAFIEQDGYLYLPGNFDFLAAQDYTEEEIEYLMVECQRHADVVVCDFGSIPESAAWYVGMQHVAFRLFVAHPKHSHRLLDLVELGKHMDLQPHDFQLILNRSNTSSAFGNISALTGIDTLLELPQYEGFPDELPLGKKENLLVEEKVQNLLISLGVTEPQVKKKGRLFL
jgi:hypothetical protein